jgi:hypothetical protein
MNLKSVNVSIVENKFAKCFNYITDYCAGDAGRGVGSMGVRKNIQLSYLMVKTVYYTFITNYSNVTSS